MSGEQFEDVLARLFELKGFTVELTPRFGDFGCDLVLTQRSARTLVQAKRWNRQVGVKAIQEAAAARPHWHCDRAMVVTSDFFGKEARQLAASNDVELWDRARLVEELTNTGLLGRGLDEYEMVCGKCGADMVVRNGKFGPFYGCSTFPTCWHKLPLAAGLRLVLTVHDTPPAALVPAPVLPSTPHVHTSPPGREPRKGLRRLLDRLVS